MEISDLIKKSLDFFDKQNNKYIKYIEEEKISLKDKKIFLGKNKLPIDINFEVLGIFHHSSNVFIWGWVLPYLSINETKISRELLNYGLNLDPQSNNKEHFYLKSIFVNSRIYIENNFDLDLIQSISSYLLKDKFNFIYRSIMTSKGNILISTFYLVKISE
jgi:hypothetical protein